MTEPAARALIVIHLSHEGEAGLRAPLEQAGYACKRRLAGTDDLAALDWVAPDLVVVMGGPMGVYEEAEFPWIGDELRGLRRRIAARRPTLGICLGSQLIAAALGARVFAGPVKEVGFAPVTLTAAGAASPLAALAGVPLLHWHGDMFDLPDDTTLLASTASYPHQAFARDRWLLALQFHPEVGEGADFGAWLAGADDYLAAAGTDAARLERAHARHGPTAVAAGRAMLTEWLRSIL